MPLFSSWRQQGGTPWWSLRKSQALFTSAGSRPLASTNRSPRPWYLQRARTAKKITSRPYRKNHIEKFIHFTGEMTVYLVKQNVLGQVLDAVKHVQATY